MRANFYHVHVWKDRFIFLFISFLFRDIISRKVVKKFHLPHFIQPDLEWIDQKERKPITWNDHKWYTWLHLSTCAQTHPITHTNNAHPPPVTPHFKKSTWLHLLFPPRAVIGSIGSMGIDSPNWHDSQSKQSARRRRVKKPKQGSHISTKETWFLPLFSFLYCSVFCSYFHSEHALQQVRGWDVCSPEQWGDLEDGESAIVSESGGTQATEKYTHKGCRLHMGRNATVDANTHKQVNKHTRPHNRQKPRKNTNSNLFTLCLLAHTQTCTHTQSGASC